MSFRSQKLLLIKMVPFQLEFVNKVIHLSFVHHNGVLNVARLPQLNSVNVLALQLLCQPPLELEKLNSFLQCLFVKLGTVNVAHPREPLVCNLQREQRHLEELLLLVLLALYEASHSTTLLATRVALKSPTLEEVGCS